MLGGIFGKQKSSKETAVTSAPNANLLGVEMSQAGGSSSSTAPPPPPVGDNKNNNSASLGSYPGKGGSGNGAGAALGAYKISAPPSQTERSSNLSVANSDIEMGYIGTGDPSVAGGGKG